MIHVSRPSPSATDSSRAQTITCKWLQHAGSSFITQTHTSRDECRPPASPGTMYFGRLDDPVCLSRKAHTDVVGFRSGRGSCYSAILTFFKNHFSNALFSHRRGLTAMRPPACPHQERGRHLLMSTNPSHGSQAHGDLSARSS